MKTYQQFRLNKKNLGSALFFLFVLALVPIAPSQTSSSAAAPDEAAVHQRADALLKQMTLEEKLGQLNQLFAFGPRVLSTMPFPKASWGRCFLLRILRRSITFNISPLKNHGCTFRLSLDLTLFTAFALFSPCRSPWPLRGILPPR